MLVYFGLFGPILAYFGLFGPILAYFGLFWGFWAYFGVYLGYIWLYYYFKYQKVENTSVCYSGTSSK